MEFPLESIKLPWIYLSFVFAITPGSSATS